MEKRIKVLGKETYPETNVLRQVTGVGAITSLTFVLTLENPSRFRKSQDVGAFLGLTPGQKQSGDRDVKLRISKRGDEGLRRLLVQSAHYLLGPFGPDCDLRRHGDPTRPVAVGLRSSALSSRLLVSWRCCSPPLAYPGSLRTATQRRQGVSKSRLDGYLKPIPSATRCFRSGSRPSRVTAAMRLALQADVEIAAPTNRTPACTLPSAYGSVARNLFTFMTSLRGLDNSGLLMEAYSLQ